MMREEAVRGQMGLLSFVLCSGLWCHAGEKKHEGLSNKDLGLWVGVGDGGADVIGLGFCDILKLNVK